MSSPSAPEPASSAARNRDQLARLFHEQPALVLTASYLALTALGLGYQFAYFLQFRVNILDYAEVSDFLLAALREPAVLLLGLLPLPLLWLLERTGRFARGLSPRYAAYAQRTDTASARRIIYPAFVAVYFLLFALHYAEWRSSFAKRGMGTRVLVSLQSQPAEGAPPTGPAVLLGKTSAFIFLYYPSDRRTHVVPIDNLGRLVVERLVRQPRP